MGIAHKLDLGNTLRDMRKRTKTRR